MKKIVTLKDRTNQWQWPSSLLLAVFAILLSSSLSAQTTISIPNCNDCAPEVATLDCPGATFNNTEFTTGEEFQASMMVPYTGGNGQPVGNLSIASTGVTGLTADLVGANLATGAGSLIFYVHGTPSGAGTASFDITFGGQTCTVDLVLTEGGATAASTGNSSCGELHTARSIFNDVGGTGIVDSEGNIWLEGHVVGGDDLMMLSLDFTVSDYDKRRYLNVPERVLGPFHGTADEVKFDEIILIGAVPTVIVARAENGETWAYSSDRFGGPNVFAGEQINGDIFCKNCPGSSPINDFGTTLNLGYGAGWGRLTTNTGKNIIDVTRVPSTVSSNKHKNTILLDEDGGLWVTNRAQTTGVTSVHVNRIAGLGVSYSRGLDDPSYLPISVPGNEVITKLASYHSGTGAVFALSENNEIYQWGSNFNGFAATPTLLQMPNNVLVRDIAAYDGGIWMVGMDNKLYSIGSTVPHQYLTSTYVYNAAAEVLANSVSGASEVPGWAATGHDIISIPPGGKRAYYQFAFIGKPQGENDNKLYFFSSTNAVSNLQNPSNFASTITEYSDLPNANLDYSSGVLGVIPVLTLYTHTNYILTNDVLVQSSKLAMKFADNELRYKGTLFPNMEYINWCYGYKDPLLSSNSGGKYRYYLNSDVISAPPGN